jgi:ABC-2 type transport system permease protein/oleandomycin transport system permease protein
MTEPARRLSPADGLRNTFTLTWRSVLKIRTNTEDLIGLSLQPIMLLVLFTYVFGGGLAGSTHRYLQYELPGILVMTVIFGTLGTGLMLNNDISSGVFDRFRSLPIARWAPLAGAVLGDTVRYVIMVAVTLAMCWVSAFIGMVVKTAQAVQTFGMLTMFPLVFGSSLLVSVKTMPGWLQAFVKVNPITPLSTATRGLMVGGPVATPAMQAMAWAVGIAAVFAPLAVRIYRRKT